MKTSNLVVLITLASTSLLGCADISVSGNPWTPEQLPEFEAEVSGYYGGVNELPGAPDIAGPNAVRALERIDLSATADDLSVRTRWIVRADWMEADAVIFQGQGLDISFDAPVPPISGTLSVECQHISLEGLPSKTSVIEIAVSSIIVTEADFDRFDIFEICRDNCVLTPTVTKDDFKVYLPNPAEFIDAYAGLLNDLAYGNYVANVDFTPEMSVVDAAAAAGFNSAANFIVGASQNGGGYALTLTAYEVSFTKTLANLSNTMTVWRWELTDLVDDALGAGELAGNLVAEGYLGSLPATSTFSVVADADAFEFSLNGELLATVAATGNHTLGFGVSSTAGTFTNVNVELTP